MVDITDQAIALGTHDSVESHGSTDWLPEHTAVAMQNHTTAASRRSGICMWALAIPQGATIDSCTIKVVTVAGSNGMVWDMKAQLLDDAAVPAESFWDTGSFAQTVASVEWDPDGIVAAGEEISPDLKTIVQEIVDRPGWVSGNNLAFLFMSRDASQASYDFASLEHTTSAEPKISVSYTAAAAGGSGATPRWWNKLRLPGVSLGRMSLGNPDIEG